MEFAEYILLFSWYIITWLEIKYYFTLKNKNMASLLSGISIKQHVPFCFWFFQHGTQYRNNLSGPVFWSTKVRMHEWILI